MNMSSFLQKMDISQISTDEDSVLPWNPETLKKLLDGPLTGTQVIVVSNREPYIHMQKDGVIEVHRPASGLVTALEPVMRACRGTWIAHGSGDTDRDVVDGNDRVQVPTGQTFYNLRRIWLTEEEVKGYYDGFANGGIWPLCHIAHVRPRFRTADWEHYKAINSRFAEAVVREAEREDPLVLIQDYHFALLPRMIRRELPKATVVAFWHIPWAPPESFGICPWHRELLDGLLGSAILGFHTRFHCHHFLETVERYFPGVIDDDAMTVSHNGSLTQVKDYPISIEWPPTFEKTQPSIAECRTRILRDLDLDENCLIGLGVDRLDYTKGIVERLLAVERLLETHAEMRGRFVFIQIAAPSRTGIDDYRALEKRVCSLSTAINERFASGAYRPVYLKIKHHEPEEVNIHYRAADVCLVTSLHDGMNLVAKEYVAARDDGNGVLVLSQFTGAAQELHEALIINPYDTEQTAETLYRALTMPAAEKKERMENLRCQISRFNVYRWAGRILHDAANLHDTGKTPPAKRHASVKPEERATWLFTPFGTAALEEFIDANTLFAFDLDGTIAPIAPYPEVIEIPAAIGEQLSILNDRVPVAVITGRSVNNAQQHLPFTPRYLVGNHGAEGLPGGDHRQESFRDVVKNWEGQLCRSLPDGDAAGIMIENKGETLSIHYRAAHDRNAANRLICRAITTLIPPPRQISGKCLENLLPVDAADKGDAFCQLMAAAGCQKGFYIGDDETDEDVFRQGGGYLFTVSVGKRKGSHARFFLREQEEITRLLREINGILDRKAG